MKTMLLTAADIVTLEELAAVLIPATAKMPAPRQVPDYPALIRRAVRACGWPDDQVREAIAAIPLGVDWQRAENFSAMRPEQFGIVATLVSAAYFMAPDVLDRLGYPTNRRHPAGLEDFANEFGSGILDPILASPPRFRDTR